eukprot:GFUD01037732.1.p1 GENE.GFUD01037732.1~~GFUD01037732.1.p1  ORF type:complete len:255 (+),score=96.94 GFUD01037732.1:89-853(+)
MEMFPSIMSQLVSSRQQVDTLEKEVAGRARENLLLKQQLEELTDFAEGFSVSMPEGWSLEEQNTALRITLRTLREDWPGEEVQQGLEIAEENISNLVRMVMAENEEQGRVVRRLERKIAELEMNIEGLKEQSREENINRTGMSPSTIKKEVEVANHKIAKEAVTPPDNNLGIVCLESSDGDDETFATMSDLHDMVTKTESVITPSKHQKQVTPVVGCAIVTTSRAKLRSGKQKFPPNKSATSLPLPTVSLNQHD